jgi:integrase/recombinase XerD
MTLSWQSEIKRLDGAFAPSTLRAYRSDVEHFETWCQTHAVLAFPVSVFDLCRYLEADGRCSSPATVRRRLYAVRKVHRL